ncbi:MAG: response regulator transcription factor [Firmicutes bacterium]|nr:response regulator transcription factor [Bacillota bacterium]
MPKPCILVVDDEKRIVRLISDFLTNEGFSVLPAYDGSSALEVFYANADKINLVILDVMMPGRNGLDVLKEIRRESGVLVVMLTARSEDADQLAAFSGGADDYVTKPFSPSVLAARVKNMLRRRNVRSEAMDFGLWQFCPDLCSVTAGGEEKRLTPKECELLTYFVNNRGVTLSREKLLNAVWDYDFYGDARTVDTHVKQLRAKLGDAESIRTIRGLGYRFTAEAVK